MCMAETKVQAQTAVERFVRSFAGKYAKAAECLSKDRDSLLAIYNFGAEHWVHIGSTNVIKSVFASHRRERAKGCVSRDSMLTSIFKLGVSGHQSWRRLKGFEYLARVIDEVKFLSGIEQPPKQQVLAHISADEQTAESSPNSVSYTKLDYSPIGFPFGNMRCPGKSPTCTS